MGMLNSKLKQIKNEVSNYWIVSANGFPLSPLEFYEAAERELAALKIPGLEISRRNMPWAACCRPNGLICG